MPTHSRTAIAATRTRRSPRSRGGRRPVASGQRAAQRRTPESLPPGTHAGCCDSDLPWRLCDCRPSEPVRSPPQLHTAHPADLAVSGGATTLPGPPTEITCSRLIARDFGPLAWLERGIFHGSPFHRMRSPLLRRMALAFSLVLRVILLQATGAFAHEGHDHADKPAAGAAALASPRVVARLGELPVRRHRRGRGARRLPRPRRRQRARDVGHHRGHAQRPGLQGRAAGQRHLRGDGADPQAGGADRGAGHDRRRRPVGPPGRRAGHRCLDAERGARRTHRLWRMPKALGQDGRLILAGLGAGLLVVGAIGVYAWRRRAASTALLAALLVVGLAALAARRPRRPRPRRRHPRQRRQQSAARGRTGRSSCPSPRSACSTCAPRTVQIETATRAVRLAGRVAANPNFSGVVQSTIPGRYEAPAGGVPPLGSRVKAGDLWAGSHPRSPPSTPPTWRRRWATSTSACRSRAPSSRARSSCCAATSWRARWWTRRAWRSTGSSSAAPTCSPPACGAEELRAPVDGIIAATRVVAGQVVAQTDRLFEIVDPARLLVEALVFDQLDPDAVGRGHRDRRRRHDGQAQVLGRSRALQQQYSLMQFEVVEARAPLNVGMPVTVIASSGAPVSGSCCRARRWRRHPTVRPSCSPRGSRRCSCPEPCARSPSTARPCS